MAGSARADHSVDDYSRISSRLHVCNTDLQSDRRRLRTVSRFGEIWQVKTERASEVHQLGATKCATTHAPTSYMYSRSELQKHKVTRLLHS
jgi:hypothetical protein